MNNPKAWYDKSTGTFSLKEGDLKGSGVVELYERQSLVVPKYSINLIRSCANWLKGRTGTIWAKEFGHSSMMDSYADSLLEISTSLANSSEVCKHCGGIIGAPLGRDVNPLDCHVCINPKNNRSAVEEMAKEIYSNYPGSELHPWVEWGNSDMQEKARDSARHQLNIS